jgi:hypothetical protein
MGHGKSSARESQIGGLSFNRGWLGVVFEWGTVQEIRFFADGSLNSGVKVCSLRVKMLGGPANGYSSISMKRFHCLSLFPTPAYRSQVQSEQ